MLPYSPSPVKLPSSLSIPQDAIDQVVVATVNPNTQALADAVAYLQSLHDASAVFGITGSTLNPGDRVTFTGSPQNGFSLQNSDTEIVVPAAGVYAVSLFGRIDNSDTSDNNTFGLDISTTEGGSIVPCRAVRWGGYVTPIPVPVNGAGWLPIDDETLGFIKVNIFGDWIASSDIDGAAYFWINRIG